MTDLVKSQVALCELHRVIHLTRYLVELVEMVLLVSWQSSSSLDFSLSTRLSVVNGTVAENLSFLSLFAFVTLHHSATPDTTPKLCYQVIIFAFTQHR